MRHRTHPSVHDEHEHTHASGCGHVSFTHGDHLAVAHDGHVDYLHDGHHHAAHAGHYDEH